MTVGSVGMLSTALHLQHLQRRRLRLEGSRLIDDGISDGNWQLTLLMVLVGTSYVQYVYHTRNS